MMAVLFTNCFVWDGSGRERFPGNVLVEGNRIATVADEAGAIRHADALVVDGRGATLIPGLIDAHSHLSFPYSVSPTGQSQAPPIEESILVTMHNARTMLDRGFTGLISAGTHRMRVEVVIRDEINAGRIPGPRLLAGTPALTSTCGTHIESQHADGPNIIAEGPDDFRRGVRLIYRTGADVVKIFASGDDFYPRPTGRTNVMTEAEVAATADEARTLNLLTTAHARSAEAIKRCLRHEIPLVQHCDFADEDALDMLEAAKDRVTVAPTIGYLHNLLHDSEPFGITRDKRDRMGLEDCLERNIKVHQALRRRGVSAAIGGDYGLPWQLIGTQARDIEHFVTYYGYKPAEALRSATSVPGALMAVAGGPKVGRILSGYLADILLVKGDPTHDVGLLQDENNLLAIMKDGVLHKGTALSNEQRIS